MRSAGIDNANIPVVAIPASKLQKSLYERVIADARVSLGIDDHAVPFTGLCIKVESARQPNTIFQNSVFDVLEVGSGVGVSVPRKVGCPVWRNGHATSGLNRHVILRSDLLDGPLLPIVVFIA